MEHEKRHKSDDFSNSYGTEKMKQDVVIITKCNSNENISSFENLANEIIYEIFNYIDFYHIYQSFYNLNDRFRSFLLRSILSIKINSNFISQKNFDCYNRDIIIPNIHRIHILRVTNYFIFTTQAFIFSQMTSLRTLILENIEPKSLKNVLEQISSLPFLYSLTISTTDGVHDINSVYKQIFRLSSLRYCKLSLITLDFDTNFLFVNEYSPIEHLIIDDEIHIQQPINYLSYVPHLRSLSTDLGDLFHFPPVNWSHLNMKNLTQLSLKLDNITFHNLELMFLNIFPFVEVLHISGKVIYINAKLWEHIISSFLPRLRIFDVFFQSLPCRHDERCIDEQQVHLFKSSFWIERGWFFEYLIHSEENYDQWIFCSTNPYRRKTYSIYIPTEEDYQKCYHSVDHVQIGNRTQLEKCLKYFLNATELTFEKDFVINDENLIITDLNRILRLTKLKTLVFKCHYISFEQIIKLLLVTSNIQTLTLEKIHFNKNNNTNFQDNELFQSFSNTNIIRNLMIREIFPLVNTYLFFILYPHLQHLQIEIIDTENIELIIQLLLDTNNQNTCHLISLCLHTNRSDAYSDYIELLPNYKELLVQWKVKHILFDMYFWK
ncbi:hypothetical protein I4U23_027204 [Adineta vaga]|nr:hypothetical protein I4U23_027204 [Adineta vaga]